MRYLNVVKRKIVPITSTSNKRHPPCFLYHPYFVVLEIINSISTDNRETK